MAIKATIYKAHLEIADLNRDYYDSHQLTIACHPSETTRRMLARIFIFAHMAHDQLAFCKGISSDDEPDLWQKSLSDDIEYWVDLGQPDERRIAKACGRAQQVRVYGYDARAYSVWLKNKDQLARFENLSLWEITMPQDDALNVVLARSMHLHCTLQDSNLLVANGTETINVGITQIE